ncbi:hypothetical protein BSU04nite_19960 [Bacillus spizizenii]|nr:hypothetical protein BSU04nite_19960 [Bacillus spizizenii]
MILFIFALFDGLMGTQDAVPDVVCIFRRNGFNFEHDDPPHKLIFFIVTRITLKKTARLAQAVFKVLMQIDILALLIFLLNVRSELGG